MILVTPARCVAKPSDMSRIEICMLNGWYELMFSVGETVLIVDIFIGDIKNI